MGFFNRLFGTREDRKASTEQIVAPASEDKTASPPTLPGRAEAPLDRIKRLEGEIMKNEKFGEAVEGLRKFYDEAQHDSKYWVYGMSSLDYWAGKKDGLFCALQYLKGDNEFTHERIESMIKHESQWSGEPFHQGSIEVMRWAVSRIAEEENKK